MKFSEKSNALLLVLYENSIHPQATWNFPLDHISGLFSPPVGIGYGRKLAEDLKDKNLATIEEDPEELTLVDMVSISPTGIRFVENQLSKKESYLSFLKRGIFVEAPEKLGEPVKAYIDLQVIETDSNNNAPASDRMVSINHNSAEYQQTETALTELMDKIRSNNEFNEREPNQRNQVLAELRAAQELIKADQVSTRKVDALVTGTFIYLIEKFADAPIGELASSTWALLKALIGL